MTASRDWTIAAAAIVAAISSGATASAQDASAAAFDAAFAPEPAADARPVAEVMFPAAGRSKAFFGATIGAIQNQMRLNAVRGIADAGLRNVIEDYIATVPDRLAPVAEKHEQAMLEAVVATLARDFSADELRDIRFFAGTAGGTRFLARAATLPDDPAIAGVTRAFTADATAALAADRAELAEKVRAYIAANPEAAPRRPEPPANVEGR